MNISKDKALDLLKEWVEQRNADYSNKCEFIFNEDTRHAELYAVEDKNVYNEADELIGTERVYCKTIYFGADLIKFCEALGISNCISVNTNFYCNDKKAGYPYLHLWF